MHSYHDEPTGVSSTAIQFALSTVTIQAGPYGRRSAGEAIRHVRFMSALRGCSGLDIDLRLSESDPKQS
jgi:hypothetical protein